MCSLLRGKGISLKKQSCKGRQNATEHLCYLVLFQMCLIFFTYSGPCLAIFSNHVVAIYTSPHPLNTTYQDLQTPSAGIQKNHRLGLQTDSSYSPGKIFKLQIPWPHPQRFWFIIWEAELRHQKLRASDKSKSQIDMWTSGTEYNSLNQPATHGLVFTWLKGYFWEGTHRK